MGWLSEQSWQRKAAAVFVFIWILFVLFQVSKFQHLPGPIYGGDLYAHQGFTLNYMMNGFWSDPYFINNYSYYSWLGNYLFIFIHFITGMSITSSIIYTPVLTVFMSAIAYYFLGNQLFKNETAGLITMTASLILRGVPDGAPNLLVWMICIPFMFGYWLKLRETNALKDKLLCGLFLGLAALSQLAFFITGTLLLSAGVLADIIYKKQKIKSIIQMYLPVVIVGVLISMLFFGPILWNYKFHTLNPLYQYNGPDVNTLGISWVFNEVWTSFISFNSFGNFTFGILALLGMVFSALNFSKFNYRTLIVWFVVGALLPLHHLITKPLLNWWLLPTHLLGITLPILLFGVIGVRFLISQAGKFGKYGKAIAVVILLIAAYSAFSSNIANYNDNQWVKYGRSMDAGTKAWQDTGEWIMQNTDDNSVFLAYDESCFAMNAVSGRKCVTVRRTHSNYFVDVEKRQADAMVMLYGTDKEQVKSLLKEYNVEYLLLDPYLFSGISKVLPKYADYLKQAGVQFTEGRERLDPALPQARVFDLLFVSGPPNSVITEMFSPVYAATADGQAYIQIAKFMDI